MSSHRTRIDPPITQARSFLEFTERGIIPPIPNPTTPFQNLIMCINLDVKFSVRKSLDRCVILVDLLKLSL